MQDIKYKTYVWSFLGRLSHWLLVSSFILCYISSFYEELLTLHVSFGIIAFGMFIKKIVWGLIGPKYARWSDYHFALKDLKFYFSEKIKNRYREIPAGHNPASSWFAFLVTWIGIFCCIIGYILYGIQEGNGFLSFLNKEHYSLMYLYEDMHIILAYVLIVMILTHITGVLIEQFYHKTHMLFAMITGYKRAKGKDIVPTSCMRVYGSIYIAFVFLLAIYTYITPNNFIIKDSFEKIDYKALNEDFYYECSDCHNLFPPYLLPKKSWDKLLVEQNEHFDEKLDLDEETISSIKSFLETYSANNSTNESAFKIKNEIKDSDNYIITKTDYWNNTHKNIPREIFTNNKVETKSNCAACHKDFENGILSDNNIVYPNFISKK